MSLRRRTCGLLALAAFAISACGGPGAVELPARSARLGILRDLVLYQRPAAAAGPFFLDRFETTRGDWHAFLVAIGRPVSARLRQEWGGSVPPPGSVSLPVNRVSLIEAREYAAWRLCRLPRAGEWRYAATGAGHYRYPWGDQETRAWLNAYDLGLGHLTPVGTFESGRQPGRVYDLLGNVAEWTESIPRGWLDRVGLSSPSMQALWAAPAFARWRLRGEPTPAWWLLSSSGPQPPRLVVGGYYGSLVFEGRFRRRVPAGGDPLDRIDRDGFGTEWERFPAEEGQRTGLRLAADPEGLLRALGRLSLVPDEGQRRIIRRFLRGSDHLRLFRSAWRRVRPTLLESGPLVPLLAEVLGR